MKKTLETEIFDIIKKVINPFIPAIISQNISLYISKQTPIDHEIGTDWEMYQLILFNVLQNAVKYNQYFGDIIIKLNIKDLTSLKKRSDDCNAVLETEIIDTGIGIEKDR